MLFVICFFFNRKMTINYFTSGWTSTFLRINLKYFYRENRNYSGAVPEQGVRVAAGSGVRDASASLHCYYFLLLYAKMVNPSKTYVIRLHKYKDTSCFSSIYGIVSDRLRLFCHCNNIFQCMYFRVAYFRKEVTD